jgi:hypothetical protein
MREPSSEAEPARGGREPSSEAEPARGGREPSSEAEPARGGALSGRTGGPWGPSLRGLCCVRMFWVMLGECLCFVFFAYFKQDSPGFLGDRRGCPRQLPPSIYGRTSQVPPDVRSY